MYEGRRRERDKYIEVDGWGEVSSAPEYRVKEHAHSTNFVV